MSNISVSEFDYVRVLTSTKYYNINFIVYKWMQSSFYKSIWWDWVKLKIQYIIKDPSE